MPIHRLALGFLARQPGGSAAIRAARLCLLAALIGPGVPRLPAQEPGSQESVATERRAPDVQFVPTPMPTVLAMLDVARVTKDDVVYDLGSGDGRIVVMAAKRYGARGVGIDIDPDRVRDGERNARAAGVTDHVRFQQADLFRIDLSEATVVTLYLLPRLNRELRPKLFSELRPGVRIVSNTFDMGGWQPDSMLEVPRSDLGTDKIYYWLLPADAGGSWAVTIDDGERAFRYDVELQQTYQMLGGTARRASGVGGPGGAELRVEDGRLAGESIRFSLAGSGTRPVTLRFEGRVSGDEMRGTVSGGPPYGTWTAHRKLPAPRKPYEVPDET
jgi:SAM-dependent methyltransferase